MRTEEFSAKSPGSLIKNAGGAWSFVPHSLPPEIKPSLGLMSTLSAADRALGELSGTGRNLPNPHILIFPFSRREAVLSSRIEGTVASEKDLASFEAGLLPPASDVGEVANYIAALKQGVKRITELPVSLRLIRELHERLMRDIRGNELQPGQFRHSQNWIGPPGCKMESATFVPPPPNLMLEALDALEKYIHAPSDLPPLIRLALVHYQFEAIHPFSDGNGRVGRLLITLSLIDQKLLSQPLLYLSAFFEKHRSEYYRLLLAVSQHGAWEEWIEFFLRGVATQAEDAVLRAKRLVDLEHDYRLRLQSEPPSARSLLEHLFRIPYISASSAQEHLGSTFPTAQRAIQRLVSAGILAEVTGRNWGKFYIAQAILEIGADEQPEQQSLWLK